MKKALLITLATLLICITIVFGLRGGAFFTQEDIDNAVNEATSSLNDKINSLKGQITELNSEKGELEGRLDALEGENEALKEDTSALESEKAALESDNAALESENKALEEGNATLESDNAALNSDKEALEAEIAEKNVELECAKGNHIIIEGGEYTYTWESDYTQCTASFFCKNCESDVSSYALTIDVNENGEYVASFGDFAPPTVFSNPTFTGVSFDSDSDSYDAETNTFTVSSDNPLVISFTGKNLNSIVQDSSFMLGVLNGGWRILDYIPNSMYGILTIDETSITLTLDLSFAVAVENAFGSIEGFGIFDSDGYGINETLLFLNMAVNKPPVDDEGYMLVSDAEELNLAIEMGEMIRLANDIESTDGFQITGDVLIDLAGYDLKVTGDTDPTFWIYSNCVLTDSVGGSRLYKKILVNGGTLSLEGAIEIEGADIKLNGTGTVDLSGYTGGEIYLYAGNFENIILPEGYAFYDYSSSDETTDFAIAKEYGHCYIRPIA